MLDLYYILFLAFGMIGLQPARSRQHQRPYLLLRPKNGVLTKICVFFDFFE